MAGILITPDPAALLRPGDLQLTKGELAVSKLAALIPIAPVAEDGVSAANGGQVQNRGIAVGPDGKVLAGQYQNNVSTRETLSFTARAILDVLDSSDDVVSRSASPVLAAPPSGPGGGSAELRAALTAVVGESGVFYENHLAQWVQGARPLASLMGEPQAHVAVPANPATPQPEAQAAPAAPASPAPDVPRPPVLLLPAPDPNSTAPRIPLTAADVLAEATGRASHDAAKSPDGVRAQRNDASRASAQDSGGTATGVRPLVLATGHAASVRSGSDAALRLALFAYSDAAKDAVSVATARLSSDVVLKTADLGTASTIRGDNSPATNAASPIHVATEGVVRQQLEMLASQQFRWEGEAWPGTPMRWEIARRREGDSNGQIGLEAGRESWSTRLSLDFPTLGRIEAVLTLSGTGVEATLATPERPVVSRLNDARSALSGSLSANGLALMRLTVEVGQATNTEPEGKA